MTFPSVINGILKEFYHLRGEDKKRPILIADHIEGLRQKEFPIQSHSYSHWILTLAYTKVKKLHMKNVWLQKSLNILGDIDLDCSNILLITQTSHLCRSKNTVKMRQQTSCHSPKKWDNRQVRSNINQIIPRGWKLIEKKSLQKLT